MYEIIFTNEAKIQLAKLAPEIKEKIGSAIERIKIKPYKFAMRLYNSRHYRVRVENYRIIEL